MHLEENWASFKDWCWQPLIEFLYLMPIICFHYQIFILLLSRCLKGDCWKFVSKIGEPFESIFFWNKIDFIQQENKSFSSLNYKFFQVTASTTLIKNI